MADKRTILSDYYEQIEKYKGLAGHQEWGIERWRKSHHHG